MLIRVAMVIVGLLLLIANVHGAVGDDKDTYTNDDYAGAGGADVQCWAVVEVGGVKKLKMFTVRKYVATNNLIASHVKNEGGTALSHEHTQTEWGENNTPNVDQGDAYWKLRFPAPCELVSSSVRKDATCHEYALKNCATATGKYEYILSEASMVNIYTNDITIIADKGNVVQSDVLVYSDHAAHVRTVRNVGGGKKAPEKIRWKWLDSGIFEVTTKADPDGYFSNPLCKGTAGYPADLIDKDGTKVDDLKWTFTMKGRAILNVLH